MSMHSSAARRSKRPRLLSIKVDAKNFDAIVTEAKKVDASSAKDRRVQVAAARLRETLDNRLGRETPPEVKALAQEAL